MIGSTQTGLKHTTQQQDRFNINLVKQIRPHLEKLEAREPEDPQIKFHHFVSPSIPGEIYLLNCQTDAKTGWVTVFEGL